MLASAFKGCSTVVCRGWNPVPNLDDFSRVKFLLWL